MIAISNRDNIDGSWQTIAGCLGDRRIWSQWDSRTGGIVLLKVDSLSLGSCPMFFFFLEAPFARLVSGWHDGNGHERAALCEPREDGQGKVRLHHRQLRCLWDLLHIEGARKHAGRQVIQLFRTFLVQIGLTLKFLPRNRHEIFLATKHGVEAKNYEGLGDAAKLKPLEVNFCQWNSAHIEA